MQPLAAIGIVGADDDAAVEALRIAVCEAARLASTALFGAGSDTPVHGAVVNRPLLLHGVAAVNAHL